jgi:hypothetical protein
MVKLFCFFIFTITLIGCTAKPEDQIKERFQQLSAAASKAHADSVLQLAKKMQALASLLANPIAIEVPEGTFSGSYSPEEVSQKAVASFSPFETTQLTFHDLAISFPDDHSCHVTTTAKFQGTGGTGRYSTEAMELMVALTKSNGKWLFSSFSKVAVLEK